MENHHNEPKFHKETFEKTSADRRQKVLEVAIEEFALNGYNATNINDISKKSGVSIGALYSYFASKEDLFLTIVDNAYVLLESVLTDIASGSSDIFHWVERMLKGIRIFAKRYERLNQIYLDLTTQALSQMSERLSNKLEMITLRLYCEIIRQAKQEGKISADVDERIAAFCIDNMFTMYQFSFSSDYYKERMKIFVGEERLHDIAYVESTITQFLCASLTHGQEAYNPKRPAR